MTVPSLSSDAMMSIGAPDLVGELIGAFWLDHFLLSLSYYRSSTRVGAGTRGAADDEGWGGGDG